ncbi:MAG: HAD-IIB family hydrolase, partial [Coprobacillus sp.]
MKPQHKLKNKVVVFDLDGTLLDSHNTIIGGEQTLECLQLLRDKGCTLAICTGRLDHDIIKVDQRYHLNMTHRISQNGAVIHQGSHHEAMLLDKDEAIHIYNEIKTKDIRIELNTVSNRYWKTQRDPDFPKELYDSHIIKDNFEEIILCQPAVLFLVIGEDKQLNAIETYVNSTYTKTCAIRTSQTSLEILHKGASKEHAVELLYPDYDIYTIGDAPSDFGMFTVAKKGYLVSDVECQYECIRKASILDALKEIIQ